MRGLCVHTVCGYVPSRDRVESDGMVALFWGALRTGRRRSGRVVTQAVNGSSTEGRRRRRPTPRSVEHDKQGVGQDERPAVRRFKEGYGIVPQTLAQDLDIRLKHVVRLIKYNATGVEIACAKLTDDSEVDDADVSTIRADVCLCTLPLGVLKHSLTGDSPKFEPALPDWKAQAIRRLGFGNLNKVVLCFDRVFWDQTGNLFGHTNESTLSRGEMFLFWSIYDAPVLIALIAGQSADMVEKMADDIIIKRCMAVLTSIFGNTVPPEPTEAMVTRWRSDPFARGSYSYVATEATGDDYDILAAPVVPTGQDLPRLFFAGEHTLRNYPATVHGALLSGLREAGRIGDQYFGCPYSPIALEEA
uniref:Amine oxidase domain-containing protein n=1 Tax=Plectus sambesii TaxID=2011161 RepID=A0A914V4G9_9BILA